MKNKIKNFLPKLNEKMINLYLRGFYKRQLESKLMEKNDYITEEYKTEVKDYLRSFNLKTNYNWHKFYSSRNGIKDKRYIPEDIFYCEIEPFLNNMKLKEAYSDKALYDKWFTEVKRPNSLVKNMNGVNYDSNYNAISFDKVLEKCKGYRKLIIKPSIDSGAGQGIEFIFSKDEDEMKVKISNKLSAMKKDYVVQEILEQHEVLKKLNPSSLNTIRMTSLIYENEVHILSSHIRIGADNSNYDHGGIVCGIENDGKLQDFAIKYKIGTVIKEHPQGHEFSGKAIPNFEKIKEIVKKEHIKIGHFRLISWDFAIDKEGEPVFIEMNLRWQGLNHHQLTTGPLFGDLTESILEEIAKNISNK